MTDIYLRIAARMADDIATHSYRPAGGRPHLTALRGQPERGYKAGKHTPLLGDERGLRTDIDLSYGDAATAVPPH